MRVDFLAPLGLGLLFIVDLSAGQYALACLIPSADNVRHFMKGMLRPLTVVEFGSEPGPSPNADVRMGLEDVLAFDVHSGGTAPFEMVGGTVGLAKGAVNFVTADFSAGKYVLLCFIPDATDHKPHVARGMVMELHVD
jgi:hypothetical protein